MKEIPKRICATCKGPYYRARVKPSVSGFNYCSHKCFVGSMKEERKCLYCQKGFIAAKTRDTKYCSIQCSTKAHGQTMRKISDQQIKTIIERLADGYTMKELALVYGVNPRTIARVAKAGA